MNITLARELLHARGYQLDMRDEAWGKMTVCRVYAVNNVYEEYLCSMTEFAVLGVAKFQHLIEELPDENEVQLNKDGSTRQGYVLIENLPNENGGKP